MAAAAAAAAASASYAQITNQMLIDAARSLHKFKLIAQTPCHQRFFYDDSDHVIRDAGYNPSG
jgi:hypothetical protein